MLYGDPEGSKALQALGLALPEWLLGDEAQTLLIFALFLVLLVTGLAVRVWLSNRENQNESGISIDSKVNMQEFLHAILIDNVHNQRAAGLTETDIIEIYEQAVEVVQF